MTTTEIVDVANHAANFAIRRSRRWSRQDLEDARAEALVEVLRCLQAHPEAGRALLFHAGRCGTYMWMRRWLRGRADSLSYTHRLATMLAAEDTAIADRLLDRLDWLVPLLHRQRSKARGMVRREIAYLRLILEGYTLDEIADRLGVTWRVAASIRERLLPKLRMILDGKEPQRKPMPHRPGSMEALRKINADPEAIARRGKAIKEALRRKREAAAGYNPEAETRRPGGMR